MKNLNVFVVILLLVVIAISAYRTNNPFNASFTAQAQNISVTTTLQNLWYRIGQNIFSKDNNWNVGIGTQTPTSKLTVSGAIESTAGGFKFPDGTVQQTAQLVGPEGSMGPPGPQGPAGQQLHLVDANSNEIGILLNTEPDGNHALHYVYLPTLGVIAKIKDSEYFRSATILSANSQGSNWISPVAFDGPNCTGTAFIPFSNTDSFSRFALTKTGTSRYFKFSGQVAPSITALSSINTNPSACQSINSSYQNVPILQEITLPFSDPLAWPLQIVMQ